MRNIHWILQENLIREATLYQVEEALIKDSVSYEKVKIIPFSDSLPIIQDSDDLKIFYGSTTLILNAYSKEKYAEGIFYDPEIFSLRNYFEKWGAHMLNIDSDILTFKEIVNGNYTNGNWFVRPIYDDKSFSGRVMTISEIQHLEASLAESNNPYLDEATLVAISKPKDIAKEWRHFIVNKEIVSSSRYAEFGQSSKSAADVPNDLLEFVKERCNEYTPNAIFVMDTSLHKNSYKIVECNCFNDTGFYEHDINTIISKVNTYLTSNASN